MCVTVRLSVCLKLKKSVTTVLIRPYSLGNIPIGPVVILSNFQPFGYTKPKMHQSSSRDVKNEGDERRSGKENSQKRYGEYDVTGRRRGAFWD